MFINYIYIYIYRDDSIHYCNSIAGYLIHSKFLLSQRPNIYIYIYLYIYIFISILYIMYMYIVQPYSG